MFNFTVHTVPGTNDKCRSVGTDTENRSANGANFAVTAGTAGS